MTQGYHGGRRPDGGDSSRRDVAWADVHEPSTSSARLAEIGARFPEFAAAIVAHPKCYPELAAWARNSGLLYEVSVNSALTAVVADPEPSAPLAAHLPSSEAAEAASPSLFTRDRSNDSPGGGWVAHGARQSAPMAFPGHATVPAVEPSADALGLGQRDLRTVLLFGLLGGIVVGVAVNLWYWLLNNPLDPLIPGYEAMGARALLYTGVLAVMITSPALFIGLLLRRPGVILVTLALTLVTYFPIDWLATSILYPGYESLGLLDRLGQMLLYVGLGVALVGFAGEFIRRFSATLPDSIIGRASVGLAVPLGWMLSFVVQLVAGEGWPVAFEQLDWISWLFGLTVAGFMFAGLVPAVISARWVPLGGGRVPAAPVVPAAAPGPVPLASIGLKPVHAGPSGVDGRYEHPKATQVLMFALLGMFVFAPLAIAAWVTGAKAKAEMAQNPGLYRPSSSLQAGYVLGIIGTLIWAAGILILLIILGWFLSFR